MAVILGLVCRLCGFSVFKLARYLKAELLLVLGTSSSESALPSLMEKMEKAGCSKSVVGLVVPTGYSFNLDGTNIYMTLAALFIAQATNTELTLGHQIALLLVAMLSSKGAAGVTGAGFITRSVGECDAWRELFNGGGNGDGTTDPSLSNVRQAFLDIFSGATAPAPANRAHLAAMSRRKATRAEKVFATGLGTTASPGLFGFQGAITINDVGQALNG